MRVFLLTSLPSLSMDAPAPLTYEAFFHRCAAHLPEADLTELDGSCSTPPSGQHPFVREWVDAWRTLDHLNRRERLQRLPRDAGDVLPALPTTHDQLRSDGLEAWQATNPLERELLLLKGQWNWIEERRRLAPYSLTDLMGYGLQLRLLERRDSWEEAPGQSQFEEHTESFLDPLIGQLRTRELSA